MYFSASFSIGAWYTGAILLVFAALGRLIADRDQRADAHAEAAPTSGRVPS